MKLDPASLKALDTAFTAAFNTTLNDTPTTWAKIAMKVGSTTGHQTYPKLSDIRGMREWVSDAQQLVDLRCIEHLHKVGAHRFIPIRREALHLIQDLILVHSSGGQRLHFIVCEQHLVRSRRNADNHDSGALIYVLEWHIEDGISSSLTHHECWII